LADYGILVFLVALAAYFNHATHGLFGQPDNLRNIGLQVGINAILAVGMTYVIITAGIDLSVGSVLGFVGIVVANTLANGFVFAGHTYMEPLSIVPGIALAFVIAIVLGGLVGAFNGFFITRWNVPPFIATLAMFTAARGLAEVYTNAAPVGPLPAAFNVWGGPVMIYIALGIVIIGSIVLRRTRFGRYVYAVGGNEEAARLSGVPVKQTLMKVYILMGVLAGLAGLLQAARLGSGDPEAGILFE
jgi:ribose/xylose/arabinose/galactoside ABC-type transport system permease subunit